MAIVTTVPYGDLPPRIEVLVSGSTAQRVSVFRMADGRQPQPVRGAVRLAVTDPMVVLDHEAPIGVPVTYSVEELDALGNTINYSTSDPTTINTSGTFLHQPLYPMRCVRIEQLAGSMLEQKRPHIGDHVRPGLRRTGVFVGAGRSGMSGNLRFATLNDTDTYTVQSMFGVGDEQMPPVLCLRTTLPLRLPSPVYLLAQSPSLRGWNWQHDGEATVWDWDVEETTPPAPSIVVPTLTYADIEAAFATKTYTQLASGHQTYSAIERRYDLSGASNA